MAQICNGLCERLKTTSIKNSLRYQTGQKRCSLCAQYFYTEDVRCPCCTTRLRSKPRTRHKKLKNLELRKIVLENKISVSEHVQVRA